MGYIDLYYDWMYYGEIPNAGLCNSMSSLMTYNEFNLSLFHPTHSDEHELLEENFSTFYWGSGLNYIESSNHDLKYKFTELRQTIILFLAAMNNEI